MAVPVGWIAEVAAEEVDEGADLGREMAAVGIDGVDAGLWQLVVAEQRHQPPITDRAVGDEGRITQDAQPRDRRLPQHLAIVGTHRPPHLHGDTAAVR